MENESMYDDDAFDRDDIDTGEFDDDAILVVRQIVVSSIVADGSVARPEIAGAIETLHRFGATDYNQEDLDDDLVILTRDGLFESVATIAPKLSFESKVALVDAATNMSYADGNSRIWELSIAREVGDALGFPRDQVEGIIGREIERRRSTGI